MNILGISAFYHDSAAAMITDGNIAAAAQEERFTRIKHDYNFPRNAVNYCLETAGVTPEQIDYVVFYEKPLLKFERLLETYINYAPLGFGQFMMGIPGWLKQKLHIPRQIDKELNGKYKGRYVFVEHHQSHAASAFFPSPFQEAAIMTLDGVGEWETASLGTGKDNKIELTQSLEFPHSLGLLYSAFTYYLGFRVNSGEYKMMGLAPYGQPEYYQLILDKLIDLKDDGSFRMDMSYFPYCHKTVMTNKKFDKLFGNVQRKQESKLTQQHMDIAASIQKVTEEIMLKIANHLYQQTKMKNLVLAGGVALNCVGNGKILKQGPFDNIWIQPAAGDAGGAIGAALFLWHQLLGNERITKETDSQHGSLLGPCYSNSQIKSYLDSTCAVYESIDDEDMLCEKVGSLINEGNVIGWFSGPMEFGPRALGNRSIIGDPRKKEMQSKMNLKIKFRESFRPFAPCVLKEYASEYFDFDKEQESPYMLLVTNVHKDKIIEVSDELKGFEKLAVKRSCIPAITHVDCSARVQTVDKIRNPRMHKLISKFNQVSGCPVIINTSFNIRGEPIVCSPENAYHCFMATDMDVLVLENQILYKQKQPKADKNKIAEYKNQFELD